jgi:dihydrofolate synthase/folylpolyglutamate synthase
MGLDRIHEALRAIKNPERAYPALHVAGTNGKGSTCAFASSCLIAQGYRVGLYTSPHLVRVNERFKVNGADISDQLLGQRLLEVLELYPQALETPAPLTYFELGTLVALWHFAKEAVDVVVLETGLGGRLDATTAARPAVTAITPISFDHMDYLGHTLQAIAQEKAGIFKPGTPAVIAKQPPAALAALELKAREVGAPVKLEGRDFWFEPEPGDGGKTFIYRGMRTVVRNLWPGLRGPHQVQNAAVALASLELLEDRGFALSQENARVGLAGTEWPGRMEELSARPTVVLDGAHNPGGVEALMAALEALYPDRPVHLVFGVLADKDWRDMVKRLFPRCASVDLAAVRSPRSLDPARLEPDARVLCPVVGIHASAGQALAAAKARAAADDVVVCCGSLFLVGELRAQAGR